MSYYNIKNSIDDTTAILLKDIDRLLVKMTNHLTYINNYLHDESLSAEERLAFLDYVINNEDFQKILRMGSALNYVNNPKDEVAISQLEDNIELNNKFAR